MIALERPAAPGVLEGSLAARAFLAAEEFFDADTRSSRQRRFDFEEWALLEDPEVIEAAVQMSNNRCSFCGSGSRNLRIHRFRPAQDAVATNGKTSRRHYWWLAYDWQNLYPACERCATAQGAKFPTLRNRVRAGTRALLNERERPHLLDPCDDDPEQDLTYIDTGEVVSSSRRGQATIEVFDLNRESLVEERQLAAGFARDMLRIAARYMEDWDLRRFVEVILELYAHDAPLAPVRRQYVNQWVQFRRRKVARIFEVAGAEVELESRVGNLRRVTNRLKAEEAEGFFGLGSEIEAVEIERRSVPMEVVTEAKSTSSLALSTPGEDGLRQLASDEIRSIDIFNFRIVERLTIDLSKKASEGSWLMLLGENGAGKSSVLQAIALALSDQKTVGSLGIDQDQFLRQGAEEGHVRVKLGGGRRYRELRFGRGIRGIRARGMPRDGVLVAAYGATRLLRREGEPSAAAPRVQSLFDPLSPLVRPEVWLPELSSQNFDAVASALRNVLELGTNQEIVRSKSGLEIREGKRRFSLRQLSDGYKAMAVLALDMMRLFLQRWGSIEAAEGIVLLDEIGAHLHPRWQMRVTGTLRRTFPRVQFIATTHDPLCLRGLRNGEVVVLENRDGNVQSLQDELPSVEGLAVDRLLMSEHFGLSSTLDPAIEERFERYYGLLGQRRHSEKEAQNLIELRSELADLRLMGRTHRERLALEAVDEVLADARRRGKVNLSALNEAAKERARQALREAAIH